jgi:hypothetical protein
MEVVSEEYSREDLRTPSPEEVREDFTTPVQEETKENRPASRDQIHFYLPQALVQAGGTELVARIRKTLKGFKLSKISGGARNLYMLREVHATCTVLMQGDLTKPMDLDKKQLPKLGAMEEFVRYANTALLCRKCPWLGYADKEILKKSSHLTLYGLSLTAYRLGSNYMMETAHGIMEQTENLPEPPTPVVPFLLSFDVNGDCVVQEATDL